MVAPNGKGGAPVVTDGPYPEAKELLDGYGMVDVGSLERAIEIAAQASAAPGPNGAPIRDRIEVRQVLSAPDPRCEPAGAPVRPLRRRAGRGA